MQGIVRLFNVEEAWLYILALIILFTGGSLHWFFALKAKATNKYHNVFDALGHQSMCLWVDKNNQYEFNNCAGAKYDTLRSKV